MVLELRGVAALQPPHWQYLTPPIILANPKGRMHVKLRL